MRICRCQIDRKRTIINYLLNLDKWKAKMFIPDFVLYIMNSKSKKVLQKNALKINRGKW